MRKQKAKPPQVVSAPPKREPWLHPPRPPVVWANGVGSVGAPPSATERALEALSAYRHALATLTPKQP